MTEIDFTPLKGIKFNCLDGCGFCCSFPAEVREWEKYFPMILEKNGTAFRKWENGHSCLNGIFTMRQQDEKGACIFLCDDKKCGIYDIRSLLCRIFPVKFFFGWRLQLYPSMSCRGFSKDEKSDMMRLGKETIEELSLGFIENMLKESKAMYADLSVRLENYIAPDVLQSMLLEYAGEMEFSLSNISSASRAGFEAELSSDCFIDLPSYLTKDLQWQVFKLENGLVRRILLKQTGETEHVDSMLYSCLTVRTLSSDAVEAVKRYMRVITSTDHFIGMVYRKAMEQKTPDVQLLLLAIAELENVKELFLLKADLLSKFEKQEYIDEKIIEDTIVLFDGYLATVPALGMIL
jgi:Fe-S-cluster containining protein